MGSLTSIHVEYLDGDLALLCYRVPVLAGFFHPAQVFPLLDEVPAVVHRALLGHLSLVVVLRHELLGRDFALKFAALGPDAADGDARSGRGDVAHQRAEHRGLEHVRVGFAAFFAAGIPLDFKQATAIDLAGRDAGRVTALWRRLEREGEFDLSGAPEFARVADTGFVSGSSTHADRIATIRRVFERARTKKLRPEEYSGGTFAISNLGMYEVVEFTAVIDPAHGAILAVGAIEEKPVVLNGQIVVRHRMRLTGSFDHRIIDGAMGAKFLQEVKKILENPVQLLL